MADLRRTALTSLTALLLISTSYSVYYHTYLDTSNPLLTHLPHPLHESHYFASKHNPLNTVFIKRAWGWTTAAFFFLFTTAPRYQRTFNRLGQYLTATALWMIFTAWFFGPALIERIILSTGGECVLVLPETYGNQPVMTLPYEYCFTKSTISPSTHPELFTALTPMVSQEQWKGAAPRLRRGHDVSGHIFLLTMSVLFLADQLRHSLSIPVERRSSAHRLAVYANLALVIVWLFAVYVTGVYFHSPSEKLSGFILGLLGFGVTQLPMFQLTQGQQTVKVHSS